MRHFYHTCPSQILQRLRKVAMHCEDQRLAGFCLGSACECRDVTKAHALVPLIAIMHGYPFLTPFITWILKWMECQTNTWIKMAVSCIYLYYNIWLADFLHILLLLQLCNIWWPYPADSVGQWSNICHWNIFKWKLHSLVVSIVYSKPTRDHWFYGNHYQANLRDVHRFNGMFRETCVT